MTITTRDGIIAALADNHTRIIFDKATMANAAAAQLFSLWTATGVPSAGSAPTTAAVCTSALTGAVSSRTRLRRPTRTWAGCHDDGQRRAGHRGSRPAHGRTPGTVTTAQGALSLVTIASADRVGDANWRRSGSGVYGSWRNRRQRDVHRRVQRRRTGFLAAVALGTPRASRLYPLLSNSAGKWIRDWRHAAATTGTAGSKHHGDAAERRSPASSMRPSFQTGPRWACQRSTTTPA